MNSKARLGSFEDLLKQLPTETSAEIESIAHELRELVLADHPELIETVRLGDGAASYGPGPKKTTESHVYIMPRQDYVNLGFYHGTDLDDPDRLLEGTGKKMRHVKVRSQKDAANPALAALVAEALAERKLVLGLE